MHAGRSGSIRPICLIGERAASTSVDPEVACPRGHGRTLERWITRAELQPEAARGLNTRGRACARDARVQDPELLERKASGFDKHDVSTAIMQARAHVGRRSWLSMRR